MLFYISYYTDVMMEYLKKSWDPVKVEIHKLPASTTQIALFWLSSVYLHGTILGANAGNYKASLGC